MMDKKTYTKPILLMESFSLTQSLSNCSVAIGFQDQACVLMDADSTNSMKNLAMMGYFTDRKVCEKAIPERETDDDGICYHTSIALVFSS